MQWDNSEFGSNLRLFFKQIHCINLDARPDRWKYVSAELARFGLNSGVQRFSAIDVRGDPLMIGHEKLLKDSYSLLAMCGCMLSHRKIVEAAHEAGLENVLVFEDDIKILSNNITGISNALTELGTHDWDVFYLGATYLWPLQATGQNLVRVAQGAYATHAIAYNHSVYERMLEILPRNPLEYLNLSRFEVNAVDKWLQSDLFDHGKFYGTNPIMVVQGLEESDISTRQHQSIEKMQIYQFNKNLKRN